eukprot:6175260-Pleurochrysis_carterae.AAC.4
MPSARPHQPSVVGSARPGAAAKGVGRGGRVVVPPTLNLGRGGRGVFCASSHQLQGAEAPARKRSRRGKKLSKTSHSPLRSGSCRQMDHQCSPGRDQVPEGGA